MKKLFSIILILIFNFNVFADTGTLLAIEKHIDDFNYAVVVEWDQKDKSFVEAQKNILLAKLNHAVLENQVTAAEIESLLINKMGSKAMVDALKLKLSLAPVNSTDELLSYIEANQKDFYQQGANWTGVVLISLLAVSFLGPIVVILAQKWTLGPGPKCLREESQYFCIEKFNNSGVMTHQDCGNHMICAEYEIYEDRNL